MTDDLPPVAGPRRYRVSFNCRTEAVGTVIGLLIREVEQPKMETVGEAYKLTLICFHDQLRAVIDMVLDDADHLIIAPLVPEVKMQPAVFRPPQTVARVVTPLQRDLAPVQRRASPGTSKTKNTEAGRAALGAFADGARVKHAADFVEALAEKGYAANSSSSILSRLVEEGDLVRIGRGAYRLPTTQDQLRAMEARDPSFRADPE